MLSLASEYCQKLHPPADLRSPQHLHWKRKTNKQSQVPLMEAICPEILVMTVMSQLTSPQRNEWNSTRLHWNITTRMKSMLAPCTASSVWKSSELHIKLKTMKTFQWFQCRYEFLISPHLLRNGVTSANSRFILSPHDRTNTEISISWRKNL